MDSISTAGATPAHQLGPRRSNYFVRHWRGELPLGLSYWANGVLIGNVVPMVGMGIITAAASPNGSSLRTIAVLWLAAVAVTVAMFIWANVGILRSARRHPSRGGRQWVASLTMFMVVMGILNFLGNWTRDHAGAQALAMGKIAFGVSDDPVVTLQLSNDGRSLQLTGPLGAGSAEKVEAALASARNVRFLSLESPGGLLHEANRIAEQVRSQRLSTYVERHCASACTLIFLAGADRAATVNAKIGFHRSSVEGIDEGPLGTEMTDAYRRAGIPTAFIRRANETPASAMWYPSHHELTENGVVTRISLAGEDGKAMNLSDAQLEQALAKLPMWRAAEKRFPGVTAQTIAAIRASSKAGASDVQALATARDTLYGRLPQLLAETTDEMRERFRLLMLEELRASLAVSPQACGLLLEGKLDVVATLPAALVKQEMDVMTGLMSTPTTVPMKFSEAAARKALAPVAAHIPEDDRAVLAAGDRPATKRCAASIAYLAAFDQLSPKERSLALQATYQGGK